VAVGLRLTSDGGLSRLLARLGISWKRAREAIHSPDPDYAAKLADCQAVVAQARAHPGVIVTLYLDEVTVGRQPTLANAYEAAGRPQPRARLSPARNTLTRVVAALNALSARVTFRRASHITLATMVRFWQDLCAAYPEAERLFVILDNWPVHTHPDVLAALEPQCTRWPFYRPRNWPTTPTRGAQQRWGHLRLPIQLVCLPTYASWCNPTEKLWRKLRQDVTHLHPWANDLETLRTEIDAFLSQFADGSAVLLRYVGLCPS
jgi:hypothetical protein